MLCYVCDTLRCDLFPSFRRAEASERAEIAWIRVSFNIINHLLSEGRFRISSR
jgi:uncharacterized membrane protein YidH (DUF202 family)